MSSIVPSARADACACMPCFTQQASPPCGCLFHLTHLHGSQGQSPELLHLVLTSILLSVKRLRSSFLLEAGVSTAAALLGSSSSAHGLRLELLLNVSYLDYLEVMWV